MGLKQPAEDKKEKETQKKRTLPKKKASVTGVWPCKINDCNKQFAREADLKRHQRTTKLHSKPSCACPQCDANFTRTDALRRHQKSRHNGVIIEPTDADKSINDESAEVRSSGSSRSGSPSSRGKGKPTNKRASTFALAGVAGSGPPSYYRQHAVTNNAGYSPPGAIMEGQYPEGIALPTSSTRLHQAIWPPPPPWVMDGQAPPIGQLTYHQVSDSHPMYFQPSPYYRSNGSMVPSRSPQINPEFVVRAQGNQNGMSSENDTENSPSSTSTPVAHNVVDPRLSHIDANSRQGAMDIDVISSSNTPDGQRQAYATAPVIDPSLDTPTETPAGGDLHDRENGNSVDQADSEALSLKITQAAVEAVFESVMRESKLSDEASRGSADVRNGNGRDIDHADIRSRSSEGGLDPNVNEDVEDDSRDELHITADLVPDRQYHSPLHLSRPEPMAHIMTEDGLPMLNPAELLTQESLASPPHS